MKSDTITQAEVGMTMFHVSLTSEGDSGDALCMHWEDAVILVCKELGYRFNPQDMVQVGWRKRYGKDTYCYEFPAVSGRDGEEITLYVEVSASEFYVEGNESTAP